MHAYYTLVQMYVDIEYLLTITIEHIDFGALYFTTHVCCIYVKYNYNKYAAKTKQLKLPSSLN